MEEKCESRGVRFQFFFFFLFLSCALLTFQHTVVEGEALGLYLAILSPTPAVSERPLSLSPLF